MSFRQITGFVTSKLQKDVIFARYSIVFNHSARILLYKNLLLHVRRGLW